MVDKKPADSAVKTAKKARYSWPPPPDPNEQYVPQEKNPIHSILTALPVIMLVVALYFYYQGETEQNEGIPILAESQQLGGIFTGFSVVNSGSTGRHYLWVDTDGETRGVRVRAEQLLALDSLERGVDILLEIAPTVSGSRTLWAWKVQQGDKVFLELDLAVK